MSPKHRGPIDVGDSFEVDHGVTSAHGQDYSPSGGMRSAVVHHVVTAFLVAMVLAVGTWGYLTFKNSELMSEDGLSLKAPLYEIPAGNAQLNRFRFALDVYFLLYEKYPPDLDALVDEGLLDGSDLTHPPGSSRFVYERVGDSYKLTLERTIVTTRVVQEAVEGTAAGTDPAAPANTDGADVGSAE